MKELMTLWKYSRMVILVALTAAIYAAILIPFKAIPLIPGVTELRPGNVCPIIFGLMFGPAGAWGSMIGNFAADLFGGTLGIPSIAGIFGNFFMGMIPYVIWGKIKGISNGDKPFMKSSKQIIEYVTVTIIASIGCGAIIGYILDVIGLFPFAVLGNIISLNNMVAALILGPFLLRVLYPRIEKWGLIWTDIMDDQDVSKPSKLRSNLLIIASTGTFIFGNIISIRLYGASAFGKGFAQMGDLSIVSQFGVTFGLIPFMALFSISLFIKGKSNINKIEKNIA